MAKSRQVNTKFWSDPFVMDLNSEEKLLFLYILTNDQVSICGIYEIDVRLIVFQVGIEKEKVISILDKFYKANKIALFSGWIAIKNFQRYQNTRNSSIQEAIKNGMEVAPAQLIEWVNNNTIITQKENPADERGTSGIPVVDERGTSPCTLLNLTLLNSTLLDGENEPDKKEEKIEHVEDTQIAQEPKKPTGISFASFEEAIEKKDDMYTHMLDRFRERNKFDKFIIEREIQKFYDYWTEKRPNAKKNRQEKEDCFDVSKRLNTWFDRVTLSEKDMIEIEKAKIIRKLEQSKKLLDDQQQYE